MSDGVTGSPICWLDVVNGLCTIACRRPRAAFANLSILALAGLYHIPLFGLHFGLDISVLSGVVDPALIFRRTFVRPQMLGISGSAAGRAFLAWRQGELTDYAALVLAAVVMTDISMEWLSHFSQTVPMPSE